MLSHKNSVPDGIGPHEGRELALLLSGQKPLAMFTDIVPATFDWSEEKFDGHVRSGRLIKREEIYRRSDGLPPTRIVYYARPSEAARIDRLHRINLDIFCGHRDATEEDDIETGRLLGYTDEHVRVFVEWTRKTRLKA